ncbi:uncharacterized protein RSE6_00805 [Rhynchosporium secalis]|uniref:Heterokaryon incompatibility domain-containing protein n=1 Tax=Rhynchosporium secalis TaxID=38038 RepID=A0A1E1LW79_RHYSE|nr:uncharacterized protein RSE6_00805 [Rhynchosporium secalis]
MMPRIFHDAFQVCIWLREDAEESGELPGFLLQLLDLAHVDSIASTKREQWQAFARLLMPLVGAPLGSPGVDDGKEATLYCGLDFAISWTDLADAVSLLGSRTRGGRRTLSQVASVES